MKDIKEKLLARREQIRKAMPPLGDKVETLWIIGEARIRELEYMLMLIDDKIIDELYKS